MYVKITPAAAQVCDIDNLKELSVEVEGQLEESAIAASLGELGEVDGEHVWLSVEGLRAGVPRSNTTWHAGFAGMIAYATSAGWTRDDGTMVRAHLVRSPD